MNRKTLLSITISLLIIVFASFSSAFVPIAYAHEKYNNPLNNFSTTVGTEGVDYAFTNDSIIGTTSIEVYTPLFQQDFNSDPQLVSGENFTVSFWIHNFNDTGNFQRKYAEIYDNAAESIAFTEQSDGQLTVKARANGCLPMTTPLSENTNHMITATFDTSTGNIEAYLDGNSFGSVNGDLDCGNPAFDFQYLYVVANIAQNEATQTVDPYKIDDFRIYRTKLNTSQISQLYNSGVGTEEDPIIDPIPTVPTIISFTTNASTIYSGQSIKLSWNVTNATLVNITPTIGVVNLNDETITSPTINTTYSLTASSANGSQTNNLTIIVLQLPTPAYSCGYFGSCNSSNILPCLNVTDANNTGIPYNGSISDFDNSCVYIPPTNNTGYNPTYTTSDPVKAIFDFVIGLFVGIAGLAVLIGLGLGLSYASKHLPFLKIKK